MPPDWEPLALHDPPGPILQDFARYVEKGHTRKNAVRDYLNSVQLLADSYGGALDTLIPTLVRRHLSGFNNTNPNATAWNRHLYALRRFYRHRLSLHVLDEDPTAGIPMLVEVPREPDLVEPDSDDNIIAHYRRYLEVERAASAHTVRAFVRSVEVLAESPECADACGLDSMTRDHIRGFLARFHGRKPSTRAAWLWRLRAFYTYRLRVRAIDSNPTEYILAPKQEHPLPRPLTESEVMALIDAPPV